MVGKVTMNGMNLPTGFSWKGSFFTNKSKGLYGQKAPTKAMEKEMKKQCPTVKHTLQQSQWNDTTAWLY